MSRIGGGVRVSLSSLREAGHQSKGMKEPPGGSSCKLFEDSYASNRDNAKGLPGYITSTSSHPDIIAFLSTKRENADEKVRVNSHLVVVPDKFYELARKMASSALCGTWIRVHLTTSDITEKYSGLVANPKYPQD